MFAIIEDDLKKPMFSNETENGLGASGNFILFFSVL